VLGAVHSFACLVTRSLLIFHLLGFEPLRSYIKQRLHNHGLDMEQLDIAITAGANQAFVNIALAICDSNDTACIIAPYYFSHKLSLQLADVRLSSSPSNRRYHLLAYFRSM